MTLLRQMLRSRSIRNVGYMSLVQVANLLIPLLTLPQVLRALEPSGYGKLALYQAIAQYLILLVDFGFYLGATKAIALVRDDRAAITTHFWVVQIARGLLAVLAIVLGLIMMATVASIRADAPIYLASLVAVFGTLLVPLWLFAGVERMGYAAVPVVIGRAVTVPLIFLFVHDPGDIWKAALINSAGVVLGGVGCLAAAWRTGLVRRWIRPTWVQIRNAYADAWHYFITMAAASFYSASTPVLLGIVSTSVQVGYFSAADRVRIISLTPLQPISNAYYPVLSRLFGDDPQTWRNLLRRLFWLVMGGMLLVSGALWLLAPRIIGLLMGPSFAATAPVLRIMAGVPLVIGINTVLGTLGMLSAGLKKETSRVILVSGIVNIGLLSWLGHRHGALGAATALLLTETLVAVLLGILLYLHLRPSAALGRGGAGR